MKRLSRTLILTILGTFFINPLQAENYVFTTDYSNNLHRYYRVTSENGETNYELVTQQDAINWDSSKIFFDYDNQKIYQYETSSNYWQVYDINSNTWSNETDTGNIDNLDPSAIISMSPSSSISSNTNNISTNTSNISTNTSNISTNTSNISTNTSNISTNTSNISTNTSNISTNTSNISTNTSNISANKSYINSLGEGVAGSTALTAALTALPQTSKESKFSCGVGTGAYSSRYAVGFGCASKVNERVDINAGGSYVFGGSKSYGGGTLDSGVVKAGFVFKLGELNKPTQISFNDKKIIDKKLSILEENNKTLNAELKLSKAKNDKIISQNKMLLARLEKLENIALKFQSSSEMISVATKD